MGSIEDRPTARPLVSKVSIRWTFPWTYGQIASGLSNHGPVTGGELTSTTGVTGIGGIGVAPQE
jgi:hypothetical protein